MTDEEMFKMLAKGIRRLQVQFTISDEAEESNEMVVVGQYTVAFTKSSMKFNYRFSSEEIEFKKEVLKRIREKFNGEVIPHIKKQLGMMLEGEKNK